MHAHRSCGGFLIFRCGGDDFRGLVPVAGGSVTEKPGRVSTLPINKPHWFA